MAPVRNKKRVSDQSTASRRHGATTDTKVPIKSPSTPHDKSPIKKRRMGISALQKQALIDNLQLEVTERARRLRAQYQLQAQGLRSRIEIRINRIPMSLRKLTMGDLLLKCSQQGQGRVVSRPPVPAKDTPRSSPQRTLPARNQAVGRGYKRMSNEVAGDKENDVEIGDGAKKRARAETGRVRPNQILSPTSSNSRLANRDRPVSPAKPQIPRPGSPLKSTAASRAAATSVLSSMVEKAKATRTRGTRKVTTTSEASSASTTATKTRRPATATASRAPVSRPVTRTGRRPSETSDISEASAGTVVRKPATSKKAAPAVTRTTVMGTIRKGVTGATTKRAAAKAAAPSATTAASGRVLRKRG
ncbi:Borealin-like protein [Metarhizium brunneum]